MHKLKITLVNGTAPLDDIVFYGERVKEIEMENLDDFDAIIEQAGAFLKTIEGADRTIIGMRVTRENGSTLMTGNFSNAAFSGGITMSHV